MKKTLFLLLILMLPLSMMAQKKESAHSCCSLVASAQEGMLRFSHDEAFIAAHLDPKDFHYQSARGEMIRFRADSMDGTAFLVKAEKPTNLYVFVFQEWWGLNDYIKQEAEDLQARMGNVNVLALDLYDGRVAYTREEAAKYMATTSVNRCKQIIEGAINYVGKDAEIATIGWCYGGTWSLQASLMAGKQAKACVIYYGMPEKDVDKLKKLNAPVLGIFANQDKFINPTVVKEFEGNMKNAGKKLTVKTYDADHAFANPSNPQYKEQYRKEAMDLVVEFYKKNFNGKK